MDTNVVHRKVSLLKKVFTNIFLKLCFFRLPFLCKHSDDVPPTPGPNGECPSVEFEDIDPNLPNCYHFMLEVMKIKLYILLVL